MFSSFARCSTILLAVVVAQGVATAAICTGNRNLALCAKYITPFADDASKWVSNCGVAAPASGVEMLMAQSIQFNTGSCAPGTFATCCTSCLACGNAGVDCTGPPTNLPASNGTGLPDGWKVAIPCAVDNADRVLSDIVVTYLGSTTPSSCVAQCAQQGFKLAGVEFTDECYCGTGFLDNVVPPTADPSECNLPCAGDSKQLCGGPWRIQLYSAP